MTKSKKIIFFGNERLATGIKTSLPIITSLVKNGYAISAIIITPIKPSLSRKSNVLEIVEFAKQNSIPVIEYNKQDPDLIPKLKSFEVKLAVLAAFGQIISKSTLDIFPQGIINLHPSILPMHRGPTPIESTILNGELVTGVSLIRLVPEMDAGPIYMQTSLPISQNITKQDLADQLGNLGAIEMTKILPLIINDKLSATAQTGQPTYDQKITKEMANLDFNKPAIELERQIRAYEGWPRSKFMVNNQSLTVTQAHVINVPTSKEGSLVMVNGHLGIETSNGILVIEKLIPAGSKEMSSSDFIKGRKIDFMRTIKS